MPGANLPPGVRKPVHHRQEAGEQASLGVEDREVFLVLPHDGDQDFLGEREKTLLEVPADHRRGLVEVHHRLEQRPVFEQTAARLRGARGQFRFDALPPLGGIHQHRAAFELLPERCERMHRDP